MRTRHVARIRETDLHPATRHALGAPSGIVDGIGDASPMPWPCILLIHRTGSGIFLDRYTRGGKPAGDTWHTSVEEAMEQAVEEYDGMLGTWVEVPDEVADDQLVAFALEHSK